MSDLAFNLRRSGLSALSARAGATPYVAAIFLSASLVFLVQPMFAKMATPLLGGAPAVWNVSLVCFQTALLAGYAYAHALARVSSVRSQVVIHAALLCLPAFVLPLSISGLFGDPDPARPALWLAGTFIVSIAPPFAVISATAPLIQNWYARSGRPDAADPYHLYAASNAGSLLGLAAYPLLLEPLTAVSTQTAVWAAGYGLLALLLIGCGVMAAFGQAAVQAHAAPAPALTAAPAEGRWRERAYWLLLAAIPSGLLLGVTTHIATDVASAPFLWAPPLMAYIATFIIVFSTRPLIPVATVQRYLPHTVVLAGALIALQYVLPLPLPVLIFAHIAVLFIVSLALHGTLAARRPDASRLTEFYLIMSAGGVVGAALVALVAPVLFTGVWEYPLMLGLAVLLRPEAGPLSAAVRRDWKPALACLALAAAIAAATLNGVPVPNPVYPVAIGAALVIGILGITSRLVPLAAFAAAIVIGWSSTPLNGLVSARGFFGVVKTAEFEDTQLRVMMHGTTLHGAQRIRETGRPTPLAYYHEGTPIAQVFTAAQSQARSVGVVGLGVGSVACYRAPGQAMTFYEIDPIVAEIARDTSRFTFLSSCAPDAPVILGDARVRLHDAAPGEYGLLLIDAFSSDAVPAHLLTREAMALYVSRLSEDGVIAFHISNRHLALAPVLARVGEAEGVVMVRQLFLGNAEAGPDARASEVVLVARSQDALDPYLGTGNWKPLEADGARPWSDDYSNVVGAMYDHWKATRSAH
ncbi:spermidine synthase [Hyphomonas sp.]|uniref:spermidine synthase n=1 Tax=Hyphomonas sp. TaxID=87 RepID=UPI00391BC589